MEPLRTPLIAHLKRLIRWSLACMLAAVLLLLGPGEKPTLPSFSLMTIAWASVNLSIVLLAWYGKPPKSKEAFLRFLNINLYLNFGYILVGILMASLGNTEVRAMGVAVILQGVGLQWLDLTLHKKLAR